MTDPKRFPVRYVGTDPGTDWLPGIPARDLSEADLRALEVGALPLVESGMYEAMPGPAVRKTAGLTVKPDRASSTARGASRAEPPRARRSASPPSAPVDLPATPTAGAAMPSTEDHPRYREFMETPDRNGGDD